MKRICLVEDEKDLHQILKFYLEKEGFEVLSCESIQEALLFIREDINVWIIDIMLPDGNGLELMRTLKNNKNIPVIIISAKGDCFDRVTGFEIGCDDYISKPFLPAELIFRIEKLLKTSSLSVPEESTDNIIEIFPYIINLTKRIILKDNLKIDITSREFDIILFFLEHKGQAISREHILNIIWGVDYFGSDRVVDNYIKNIRKKLPFFELETIYGFGYRYNL